MNNLRKLIREGLKKVINESMDMGIDDFSYSDELENILDMTFYIKKKMNGDLWNSLTQQTRDSWDSDDITPDGFDAFEPTGTINLYVGGFDVEDIKKIIGFIKYVLGEHDIKVGEAKWEKVREKVGDSKEYSEEVLDSWRVVRIPIIENNAADSGNPPQVNMSNGNATELFEKMLGFSKEGVGYRFNAHELLQKINEFRKSLPVRTDIPETSSSIQQGNMISPVHGKDYFYRQLEKVEEFANWAIKKGYTALHIA